MRSGGERTKRAFDVLVRGAALEGSLPVPPAIAMSNRRSLEPPVVFPRSPYVNVCLLRLDLNILARTATAFVRRDGITHEGEVAAHPFVRGLADVHVRHEDMDSGRKEWGT